MKATSATVIARWARNGTRSAIAPETIAATAAAKPIWRQKTANALGPRPARPSRTKNPEVPITPPASAPNSRPEPHTQKASAAVIVPATRMTATLMPFLGRVSPACRSVKPACMNSTSAAESASQRSSVHAMVSM